MRNLLRTVFLMCAALGLVSSCGDESTAGGNVTWNCTCQAVCDTETSTVMRSICASPEGAATAVDQGTDACIAGLPDTCVEATCGCECTATGSSCS